MNRVLCLLAVAVGVLGCGSGEPQEETPPVGFFTPYSNSVCEEIQQVVADAPSAEVHMQKDLSICRVKVLITEGKFSFVVFRFEDISGLYRTQEVGSFATADECNAALEMLRPFFGTTICAEESARKPFGY